MTATRTRGQVEAAITAAFTQFERDFLGRGPREARAYILGDVILVRLKGVLSPAEQQLGQESDGVGLIKQVRSRLIEGSRETLAGIIMTHTESRVVSMHTDISTRTGERVFVFVVDDNLDDSFSEGSG